MGPQFAIGSLTSINGEDWQVVRYHRVNRKWEVMFRNVKTGKHTSIPLFILETHATYSK